MAIKDEKNSTQKCLKCTEELGELDEAILSYSKAHACSYKGKTEEDVLEEACDVIQCVIALTYSHD